MERINNVLERTLRTSLIAADWLLLLKNEAVDKNNIQEIKSQLVRLLPLYNDLVEQLLEVFLQTLPHVVFDDVKFPRKITFNGETLTITCACPICHANFGCCH